MAVYRRLAKVFSTESDLAISIYVHIFYEPDVAVDEAL